MGVTHQAHNIPWVQLAEAFVLEPEYSRLPGGGKLGTSTLKLRRDWPPDRVFKAVRHFARRLAWTVEQFGRTERQKYPHKIHKSKVYEEEHFDEILVGGKYQQVEYWRQRQIEGGGRFDSGDGDLADVAKQLLHRGLLDSLLLLVHEGIRLDKLACITYSNFFHYGIRRILDDDLELYILLNLAVAMDTLGDDHRYWPTQLRNVRDKALSAHDYDVHRLPNAAFFELEEGSCLEEALTPHLSHLFRCLYQYHVLMVECGRHENWEKAALCFLPDTTPTIDEYMYSLELKLEGCGGAHD